MKKFLEPEVEVISFEIADILTTSSDSEGTIPSESTTCTEMGG